LAQVAVVLAVSMPLTMVQLVLVALFHLDYLQ
jgi:hypothetical protein